MRKLFKIENKQNPSQTAYVIANSDVLAMHLMRGITSLYVQIVDYRDLENYPGIVDKMYNKSGVYMNSIPPF